ncbi:MAG: hypothetical protein NTW05_08405 [Pseudonocardiales bacterium]|jgi:hypothetical protein|nr:hypothetical protein [Pseudonocardiales bacterium]
MTTLPSRGRATLAVLAWIGATLFGLAVAATTRIGPVVWNLSYNHGIHLGDVLAFAGAYLVAALVTASALDHR